MLNMLRTMLLAATILGALAAPIGHAQAAERDMDRLARAAMLNLFPGLASPPESESAPPSRPHRMGPEKPVKPVVAAPFRPGTDRDRAPKPPAQAEAATPAVPAAPPGDWRAAVHPGHRARVEGALDTFASVNGDLSLKKYFDIRQTFFAGMVMLSRRKLNSRLILGEWGCQSIKVTPDSVFGFRHSECRFSRRNGQLFFEKQGGKHTGNVNRSGFLFEDDGGRRLVFLGGSIYGEDAPPLYSGLAKPRPATPADADTVGVFVPGVGRGSILGIFPEAGSYELYHLSR